MSDMGIHANILVFTVLYANLFLAQDADSLFGRAQVEQFIRDRPGVGDVIEREPALREVLEAGFKADAGGKRIYWDCREPKASVSERIPPYLEYPSLVRVSRTIPSTAVDMCVMLLFELYHTPFEQRRDELFNLATKGRISRNDFARSCVRLEFQACRKTQTFFREHPIADEKSKENDYYKWVMQVPSEFSEYLRSLEARDSGKDNLFQYYLKFYDQYAPPSSRSDTSDTQTK
jgi:hypothetical protein